MPYLDETGLNHYDEKLKTYIDDRVAEALQDAKDYADDKDSDTAYDDTQIRSEIDDLNDKKHTHTNKEELDNISEGDVAKWNAAEQNAKGYTDTAVTELSQTLSQNISKNAEDISVLHTAYVEADTALLDTVRKGIMPRVLEDVPYEGTLVLNPNVYYVLKDNDSRNSPIMIRFADPTDTSIVNEYKFRVTITSTTGAADFLINGSSSIKGLPTALVVGNTYEVSVVDDFATYAVWEA